MLDFPILIIFAKSEPAINTRARSFTLSCVLDNVRARNIVRVDVF